MTGYLFWIQNLVADKEEKEIPLPNVKGKILAKVIEYLKYHSGNPAKDIERPLKSANMREVVSGNLKRVVC